MSANGRSAWASVGRVARGLESTVLVTLLGGLVLLASAQIVLRNFFSIGLTWADGLIRLMVLWLALAGAVAAAREGRHIAIGALTRWLPPGAQRGARACSDAFGAVVCGLLAWYSWLFVRDSYRYEDTLLDALPAWIAQLPLPIAFGLISATYALGLVRTLRGP